MNLFDYRNLVSVCEIICPSYLTAISSTVSIFDWINPIIYNNGRLFLSKGHGSIEIEFKAVPVSGFFQELIPDQFIISAKLVIDNNG